MCFNGEVESLVCGSEIVDMHENKVVALCLKVLPFSFSFVSELVNCLLESVTKKLATQLWSLRNA